LGEDFEIMRTSVKPHACCRYMQAPIDGLIELATVHDIFPEQIKRIEIAVLEAGWPLVCLPRKRKYAPANVVDAQFSMPYGAAVALTDRAAGLDQFAGESLRSPEIKALMGKVVLEKNIHIEKDFPREWPSIVRVCLTSGREFEKRVRFPKGDPQNPLTWQDLSTKFHLLATRVLPMGRCDQIVKSVKAMKTSAVLHDIWELMDRPDSNSRPAN
jgi:2-methylcitrate dehydratase PrpD